MKLYKAIILAGGVLENSFKEQGINTCNKAFIEICGKPMVGYVIEALKKATLVEDIILAIPEGASYRDKEITIINSGDSIVDTVLNGFKHLPENTDKTLLAMSDLPVLTPEAIDDFLKKCNDKEADYNYSIISKEVSEGNFPDFPHTYAKLTEGSFCGGGLTLLSTKLGTPCRSRVMLKLTRARKNLMEMVRVLGLKILLKFLLKKASIKDVEEKFSEIFDCTARAIISPFAEIGINVDKPTELELVRSYFSSNKNKVRR